MPAQEVKQPQSQQMEMVIPKPQEADRVNTEQPRAAEQMTAEPVSMRGGGKGGICCGL
ncbi:Uncharacterized protein BP5553_06941 [Venustampulla echinocandica]|uniref:Uncharacterized protein n=1 Tax=Venustampulla echinocandica TaxID=2656787 RepID=A0A370TI27_9HELO|nr:Uncharacterized protein BP5553_06941 [Venustampulla echinocandica]RDL35010.1 Uncharacterized protein BP5553_06941 [Venustampulla echinocandica]